MGDYGHSKICGVNLQPGEEVLPLNNCKHRLSACASNYLYT